MTGARPGRFRLAVLILLILGAAALLIACGGEDGDLHNYARDATQVSQPVSVQQGQHSQSGLAGRKLFAANCSRCHGAMANGTNQGPPLINEIYEPGHHSNASFVLAVARGVRAHHWEFGNMPAVPDLSIDEIHQVICYVRELQLANGIIDAVPTSTPC